MTKIGPMQNVEFSAPTTSVGAADSGNVEINFSNSGDIEDRIQRENTKESVQNTLQSNKKDFELKIPWIGTDYVIYKGDGKTTYGQLRERLGIPPKVLSETNGKRLTDEQIVEQTRINLDDIGWYPVTPQSDIEAQDIRAQRNYGNHYAGYDRAVNNNDIKNYLK